MYRSRQALAVDVLLTLLLARVLILYLIEHDILDSVGFGRPFEMLCNCCLIFVKHESRVCALASGSREEDALFIHRMEAIALYRMSATFLVENKAECPTIGDRLRTRSVPTHEDGRLEDWTNY